MAGTIRISPDEMRMRSYEYSQKCSEFNDIVIAMDNLLMNLQQEWEGSASEAFAIKFNELKPSFIATKELIEEISRTLGMTAQALEDVDAQLAGQIRGLD